MRIESSVTSLSWIPSEAIGGLTKLPFEMGMTHYDEPPPDQLGDLDALRIADRFRFANQLRAWIDVADDGRIVGHGYEGGGSIGSSTVRLGRKAMVLAAVAYPDLRSEPEVGAAAVRSTRRRGAARGSPPRAGCAAHGGRQTGGGPPEGGGGARGAG